MCKNGFKMCNLSLVITLHIIAGGHHLGMVVTMKGYTAIIVDIIGFLSKKEKNIYGDYAVGQLFRIYHKKVIKHFWRVCCVVSYVTSLTGVHIK